MKNFVKAMVGVGLLLCGMVTALQAGQYDYEVKDKKISFAWKVEGDKLAVKLAAETEGWVGIGFNPSKEMKDADFIIAYVKDGETKIFEEFGDSESSHSPDKKNGSTTDVALVGGTESGGITTVEFTIPLKSTDKNRAININGDTVVLLAYAGRDSLKTKHTYRTALKVNLGTGASQKAN